MKNILDQLFAAYSSDVDSDAIQLSLELKEKLLTILKDEELELFNKFINSLEEAINDSSRENFRQGFHASMKFAIKILNL